MIMKEREIYVTALDVERLRKLLEGVRLWSSRDREHLEALEGELDRAHVVAPQEIPGDIVTMNSAVLVRDLDTDAEMALTLVFPSDTGLELGKISILAPVGTALLGYRVGDTIEWKVPGRVRRLRIERMLYQPEAAGDFHR
jgi:regulator of nucleoside diphosphate kinase